ncbi:Serine/threonine-protein kinase PRR1 [Nakaseomyces bracarensis]|uniref:Serine/threonine-protein kinase PRR1 n=1 Tax=Nakaseomyces bracarensis TaxID=273131 RepID=A0ABR4NUA3_9SACH
MSYEMNQQNPKTPRIPQTGFDNGFNAQRSGEDMDGNFTDDENRTPMNENVSVSGRSDDTTNTTFNDENGKIVTPLSVSIPTFENVTELPTPMIYSPMSPAIANVSPRKFTPSDNKIHVNKRRGNKKPIDEIISTIPLRLASEVLPPIDTYQQRISSLPAVTEEEPHNTDGFPIHHDGDKTATEEDNNLVLIGYRINHYNQPVQWRKVKTIGVGNFSDVLLYESLDQNDPELFQVAVKRMRYPDEVKHLTSKSPNITELLGRLENSLTREISILNSINHPCIVKLFGVNDPIFMQSSRPLYDMLNQRQKLGPCNLIMSYCSGGDLLAAMATCSGNLDMWLVQRIFTEVVIAVKYLHDRNIIHRDLKLENVLLRFPLENITEFKDQPLYFKQNFIELADFGLSKKIERGEMCTARCGSEDYVSPEILMGVPYDGHLSDSWALGVILYSLLEDRLPFDPLPNSSARQRNRPTAHRIARFEWKWNKLLNEDCSAKEIVKHTLTRRNQRWNCTDIYQSKYIQEIVNDLEFVNNF